LFNSALTDNQSIHQVLTEPNYNVYAESYAGQC